MKTRSAGVDGHRQASRRTPGDASQSDGFLFCRNDYHLVSDGVRTRFDTAAAAREALHDDSVSVIVGALPFDSVDPVALTAPLRWIIHPGPWVPNVPAAGHTAARVEYRDPPHRHRRRIAEALKALRDPDDDLDKVVLARTLRVALDEPMSAWDVAARLRGADPAGSVFLADLSAAPGWQGRFLVGASPEVLVRKNGTEVTALPLAGSAARHNDATIDAARCRALAASSKDHAEHRFVVDALAAALAPLCRSLEIPDEPVTTSTPAMWHLGTPIRGEVADRDVTALELALAAHPTPAVCGSPTALARNHIRAAENPRGFYAGAVGWSESSRRGGNGEWMVSIRCAELAADGRSATTWAGGGIVADSDPDAEVAETDAKLATMLAAFGLDPATALSSRISSNFIRSTR